MIDQEGVRIPVKFGSFSTGNLNAEKHYQLKQLIHYDACKQEMLRDACDRLKVKIRP